MHPFSSCYHFEVIDITEQWLVILTFYTYTQVVNHIIVHNHFEIRPPILVSICQPLSHPQPPPSATNLTVAGPCHSVLELSCVVELQLEILTASLIWRVRGSLKLLTTFIEKLTAPFPPWTIWSCFHRGESGCLPL